MINPLPLLINIGHGKYQYVGINHQYSGIIVNVPSNEGNLEYKIGEWNNGVYSIDNYIDFSDWRNNSRDNDGNRLILLGTEFELRIGDITRRFQLSNNTGENLLSIESSLGKIVHRKYVGFIFKRPNYNDECEILNIF